MILFRADGNEKIGAGHLMRCLTIADCVRDKEGILFVCADRLSVQTVEERGYRALTLGTDYRDLETELPLWEKWIKPHEDQVILADSYYVTERYLETLGHYGRVALMDDLGERAYPVTTVINYNVFARQDHYRELYAGTDTVCLTGGSYVPIRPQFTVTDYRVRRKVKDVLITTGGGDYDNIAGMILERIKIDKLNYHVIIGRFNPHYEELKKLEQMQSPSRIFIHRDVKDMAALMKSCDMAVTAGGTTVYELAAVGVPLICFSYAENQEALVEYIGREGIGGYGGPFHLDRERTLEQIGRCFRELLESFDKRNACYIKGRSMVDGQGAARLAEILERSGRSSQQTRGEAVCP